MRSCSYISNKVITTIIHLHSLCANTLNRNYLTRAPVKLQVRLLTSVSSQKFYKEQNFTQKGAETFTYVGTFHLCPLQDIQEGKKA